MTELTDLWLPIFLSSVLVFVASSIIHTLSPWHKNDYPKAPNEDQLMDAVRPLEIPPGDYMVPRPSSGKDMQSPEFLEKLNKGPVMILTMLPNGMMSMARNLTLWFLYSLIVSVFAAYVAGSVMALGEEYLNVFRITGVTAFLGYSAALWQMSIWYRRSWSTTIKATVDGLIYGMLTAGVFGWLWPK